MSFRDDHRAGPRRAAAALLVAAAVYLGLDVPMTARAADPGPANADRTAVVDGNNRFAVDLYGQLRKQEGNLFFSPASISTVLAMAYAGARGSTATEMAQTLGFSLGPDRFHPAMGELLRAINAGGNGYELHEANALWLQDGYAFHNDFLKLVKDNYGAELGNVDFQANAAAAAATINHWVETQTSDKIRNLIQPGALSPGTRLVLTNAIYFKGDWLTQFDKEETVDQDFRVAAGRSVRVPLMHLRSGGQGDSFAYFDGGSFQALDMPYKGRDLSMIVFLPKAGIDLSVFEQSMTAANIVQWQGKLLPCEVDVRFPKFKTSLAFNLGGQLQALGIRQAFMSNTADFSGIADGRNLFISSVVHKAYVAVDEKGTEAAAATAVVMRSLAVMRRPPVVDFVADHPFVFLIRDNRSGSILFMGRITDPSAQGESP